MSIDHHNKTVWNKAAESALKWSTPISDEQIKSAKLARPELQLTYKKSIPDTWTARLKGKKVLVVGGSGGQQVPLLAAFGCEVTALDISSGQLELDRKVLLANGLEAELVEGSYQVLSTFQDSAFDAIINPVSNCYFSDIESFWIECYRVLRDNGFMFYGFINPLVFQFDFELANRGTFTLRYPQPFSDEKSLCDHEKKRFLRDDTPFEFGHSLSQQIGAPLKMGFKLVDFFEDGWDGEPDRPIDKYFPQFIAGFLQK